MTWFVLAYLLIGGAAAVLGYVYSPIKPAKREASIVAAVALLVWPVLLVASAQTAFEAVLDDEDEWTEGDALPEEMPPESQP